MAKSKSFSEKVYELTKKVPKGNVTTYKLIAEKMGCRAYRAVGNALNKNPNGILECGTKDMVPCHRVVDSKGHLHGFAHGLSKKAQLLRSEGLKIKKNKIDSFKNSLFRF